MVQKPMNCQIATIARIPFWQCGSAIMPNCHPPLGVPLAVAVNLWQAVAEVTARMKHAEQPDLFTDAPRTDARIVSGWELPAVLEQVRRDGGHVEGVQVKGATYKLTIRYSPRPRDDE
jgi:hypothetical protein